MFMEAESNPFYVFYLFIYIFYAIFLRSFLIFIRVGDDLSKDNVSKRLKDFFHVLFFFFFSAFIFALLL